MIGEVIPGTPPAAGHVSLWSERGEDAIPLVIWRQILGLAAGNGWAPRGTQMEWKSAEAIFGPSMFLATWTEQDYERCQQFIDEWDGNYLSGEGQSIIADDAAALADALRRSLTQLGPDVGDRLLGQVISRVVDLRGPVDIWIY
jgi:hypothetical protein